MQIANLGNINGTIGVIFWRWGTAYWAELPSIVKNQSKPERFFIWKKKKKKGRSKILKTFFFLENIVKPKEFLQKNKQRMGLE